MGHPLRVLVSILFSVWASLSSAAVFFPAVVASGGGGSGSANITLPSMAASNVTSRTSCVAPCAVFFDVQTTTSGLTSRPFHELLYQWDFGDPVAGAAGTCTDGAPVARDAGQGSYCTGAITGNANLDSKNYAEGPVAAHVFESPGTFTVTLTASQGDANFNGSLDSAEYKRSTVQITVGDPEQQYGLAGGNNKTACIANGATPVAGANGCPANTTGLYNNSDADVAIATALTAGYRRILFRRGDTFSIAGSSAQVSHQGPGVVGAYGSGAKPVFDSTMIHAFRIGNSTPGVTDAWTLMDVKCNYPSDITNSACLYLNSSASNTLMLRVDSVSTQGFKSAGSEAFGSGTSGLWDGIFLVDGTVKGVANASGNNGNYITGYRVAMIGYHIDMDASAGRTSSEHGTRTYAQRVVESHNTIEDTVESGRVGLSNRSFDWTGGGGSPANVYSGIAVIANNRAFNVAATFGWGSTNQQTDGRNKDIIVERNVMESRDTLFRSSSSGHDLTIRNNLDRNIASSVYSIIDAQGFDEGISTYCPSGIYAYHNTVYSSISAPTYLVTVGNSHGANGCNSGTDIIAAKNNLMYSPSGTNDTESNDQASTNGWYDYQTCASCNSTISEQRSTNPFPGTPTLSSLSSFTPSTGAYTNAGADNGVPVWNDFYGNWWQSSRDVGAVRH